MCSACGRVNAKDARFCDWCGIQVRWGGGGGFTNRTSGCAFSWLSLLRVHQLLCWSLLPTHLQPKRTIMDVVCRVCSVANNWQARFCSSCKLLMEPSIRPSHVEHSSRWKVGRSEGRVALGKECSCSFR